MTDQQPALKSQKDFVLTNNVEILYTLKTNNYTKFDEMFIKKSVVNIQSDLTGFMSDFFERDYTIFQLNKGIDNQFKKSSMDPMNEYKDDLVYYLNIVMDSQGNMYSRQHYTLIDLLEQQGGVTQCIMILALLIVYPFNYKRHELKVFYDYEKKMEKDAELDNSFLENLKKSQVPIECLVFIEAVKKFFSNLMPKNKEKEGKFKRQVSKPKIKIDEESK